MRQNLIGNKSSAELMKHLHGRPTQVTRYNTGYERVTDIPLSVPSTLIMPKPMEPMLIPMDPLKEGLEKISKNLTEGKDPSKVVDLKNESAESQLKGDMTDLENIKKTIIALDSMNVSDPEIRNKLDLLKERKEAYEQLLEGKAPGGGPMQARVNKIKKDLKKKSTVTAEMEKSMADTATERDADAKDYESLTITLDPKR